MFNFYKNKKVIVTGHTGFKGSWLTLWLKELGADVVGVSLDPKNLQDAYWAMKIENICKDIRQDIRDFDAVLKIFKEEKPDIVFHLAAQALVLESYTDPVYTYSTNFMGTVNILEAIKQTPSVVNAIFITTDKVYENKEFVWGYRENDPLGGFEPYGTSKAAAELAIVGYQHSYFKSSQNSANKCAIATVRAGNVIGGGDWSENRIIPDCIRHLKNNETIIVRNPNAIRPWQHVLEALGGYLMLCYKMNEDPQKYAEAWNFGPGLLGIKNVEKLVEEVIMNYGKGNWKVVNDKDARYESNILSLDISKANLNLGWRPLLSFEETIKNTVEWYKQYLISTEVRSFSVDQINNYQKLMLKKLF